MAKARSSYWRRVGVALASMTLLLGLVLVGTASAVTGPVGTAIGFEDDDGNLAPEAPINSDWNSFAPTTWTGTAPARQSDKVVSGWTFKGLEDWQASTADSAFAGGTKQDQDCPTVITQKADNKADLKRIYLAAKTGGNGHTYLTLAWVRIPQNTTSPSAHIAFEFNKGSDPCSVSGTNKNLVHRVEGDMLVLYDFEGGSTDNPTIRLSRWILTGTCEISSDNAPCWGPADTLTSGEAEAKVNTFGSVSDGIAPSPPESLGTNEFGEAGIDLTNAGVFTPGVCESFGKAFGVSRTSGNSGTAQMKDLVGPGNFTLSNCGEIKIIKRTSPRGLNQDFGFTSDIPDPATPVTTSSQPYCQQDTSPSAFTLNDNGNTTSDSTGNTEDCVNVASGTYHVTEGADPAGFAFDSLTCTSSGTGTSATTSGKVATITVAGGGVVTCVYVNKQQLGAIKITKTSTKGSTGLNGATFSITKDGTAITGSPFTTQTIGGVAGVICVDNLAFGDYVVTETGAPTGYKIDDTGSHTVTVDNNAKCSDATYVGEAISFTDTPLSTVEVKFTSLAGAGVTKAQIVCKSGATVVPAQTENGSADNETTPVFDDTDETFGNGTTTLVPGTYTCTVVIDP